MAELDQKGLFAACRAIYELAGQNYILPPLIRDAGKLATQPGYTYNFLVGKDQLQFLVALDEAYADRNSFPQSKLPLKFHVAWRDAKIQSPAVELAGSEKFELIRAFLLGAKVPILAEKINEESAYKLSIQLSSTFFVDFGELGVEYTDCFSEVICSSVGRKIYERSSEFFDDRQRGLAVWSLRAAQGLFGEPKPAPEALWPDPLKDAAAVAPPMRAAASEQVGLLQLRYPIAATVLVGLLGSGALTANFCIRGEPVAPLEMAASPIEIELADLQPERMFVAPAEANNAYASFGAPLTSAFLPPVSAENRFSDARLQETTAPAIAAAPEPLNIQTASLQRDRAIRDDYQASQAATLAAPAPDDAPYAQAKSKQPLAVGPGYRGQHRLATRSATPKQQPPLNPLEFTRIALASLTVVVKGLERIPDAILNPNKRLKI